VKEKLGSIIGIYEFFNTAQKDGLYLLYVFDDHGHMDYQLLNQLYEQVFGPNDAKKDHFIGPFRDESTLQQFAYRVCEEIKSPHMNLVSVGQYNEVLSNSHTMEVLAREIKNCGTSITNSEFSESKKTLFDKLFK